MITIKLTGSHSRRYMTTDVTYSSQCNRSHVDIFQFFLYWFRVYYLYYSKTIGNFPGALNSNRLFLKHWTTGYIYRTGIMLAVALDSTHGTTSGHASISPPKKALRLWWDLGFAMKLELDSISNCFEMLAASRGSWTLITESLLVIIKAPWSLKLKPVFCIQMLATPLLLVKTFRSSFCALLSWVNMQQKEPTHLVTCWTPHWLFRFDPHESGFCILFVYKGPWASCGKFFHLIHIRSQRVQLD